jgi:hypothetical protein
MADYNVISGSSTNDSILVGNISGDDSVSLLAGNDTVTGSGVNDIVDFGSGNDLLTQPGAYSGGTVLGGSGNDVFVFANKASSSEFAGQADNDSLAFVNTSATFSAVTISGGLSNDSINLKSGSTLLSSSVMAAALLQHPLTHKIRLYSAPSKAVLFKAMVETIPSLSLAKQTLPPSKVVWVMTASPSPIPLELPPSLAV